MIDQKNFSGLLFSKKDHNRENCLFTIQTALMASVGQVPYIMKEWLTPALGSRRLSGIFSYLYSGFIVLQTFHTSALFLKTTFDMFEKGALEQITNAFMQVIIFGCPCYTTCYMLWHTKALTNFISFIDTNYWHHSLPGLTFVSSFESFRKARRITFYWFVSGLCGSILYGIAPLLQGSHALPLNCWYPFDPLQPGVYTFIYILQILTQINMGITYVCGSAVYTSFIVLLLGQFDVLFCSLKNLYHHTRLFSGVELNTLRAQQEQLPSPEEDELNQYLYSEEHPTDLRVLSEVPITVKSSFALAFHYSLVKCVKHHQFICECCKILENLYHPYLLMKSLQITFQICLLLFVGVAGEKSLMRMANLLQYLGLTIMDLLFFTYCADLLRQHSVRSGEAFARSEWVSHLGVGRTDILIFLINSQRPIQLTAGKFFVMDINRLRLVFMQAFSFLTLLQNLAAKKNK